MRIFHRYKSLEKLCQRNLKERLRAPLEMGYFIEKGLLSRDQKIATDKRSILCVFF